MIDMENVLRKQVEENYDPKLDVVENTIAASHLLKRDVDIALYNLLQKTALDTEAHEWEVKAYDKWASAVKLEQRIWR